MDSLPSGWFTELSPDDRPGADEAAGEQLCWTGQAFSLRVEQVLLDRKSDYQHVQVVKTATYGNALILDGIVQCTERDEFTYQEMLTHTALCAHPCPKQVLIVGGGDGGCAREVLKHDCVERVVMCEIDQLVIDASKQYLPGMASSFEHPKMELNVGDGFEYVKNNRNVFDVIITDSSDPMGPASDLFGLSYYELLRDALTDNGVIISQGESIFLHLPLIKQMVGFARSLFATAAYGSIFVPTYPCGNIGFVMASKNKSAGYSLRQPSRVLSPDQVEAMQLRYYNSGVHRACFVLPQFAANALQQPPNAESS